MTYIMVLINSLFCLLCDGGVDSVMAVGISFQVHMTVQARYKYHTIVPVPTETSVLWGMNTFHFDPYQYTVPANWSSWDLLVQ